MKKSGPQKSRSPSQLIDARIAGLSDWRGDMLARVCSLIREADRDVVEAVEWRKTVERDMLGVPVWEHAGIICTGATHKDRVKLTFAKGASLKGPSGIFNSTTGGQHAARHQFPRGRQG
jgi:hypothetical protein